MLKEAKGIETFFSQFDVNKNGRLERDEFNLLFDRINRIVDKKKEMDLADELNADELASGDQNFATDAFNKVKNVFTSSGKTDDSKLAQLVQTMERDGMSTKVFHSVCLDFQ